MLELAAILTLARTCAPEVAPETLAAIAHVESRFDPLAIGVNRGGLRPRPVRSSAAAARTARRLLASGANIDLGLAQINSDNLIWLGLSIEDAFDPCLNLRAAATVLRAGYRPVANTQTARQAALRVALSRYNTGHPRRGFRNGYVARVEQARVALKLAPEGAPAAGMPAPALAPTPSGPAPDRRPPAWDVFARSAVRIAFSPPARSS